MHSIRLRHPWQSEADDDVIRWSRKFNWPAELTPEEVVHLVVESSVQPTAISLNNSPLPLDSSNRYVVTALLAPHNQIVVEIDSPPAETAESCPLEVRLEISSIARG